MPKIPEDAVEEVKLDVDGLRVLRNLFFADRMSVRFWLTSNLKRRWYSMVDELE